MKQLLLLAILLLISFNSMERIILKIKIWLNINKNDDNIERGVVEAIRMIKIHKTTNWKIIYKIIKYLSKKYQGFMIFIKF